MSTDYDRWRDLEAEFQKLRPTDPQSGRLVNPECARLTAMVLGGQWALLDGPSGKESRAAFQGLFRSFARTGASLAGVPGGANGLDGWLTLLRDESPRFHRIDVPDGGGWIQDVALASAEYCIERASRAFELENSGRLLRTLSATTAPQSTDVETTGADLAQPAGGASTKGRKRGPKPDHDGAARVAEIVARVAPDGDWRSKADDVGTALDHGVCDAPNPETCDSTDHEIIPLPRGWKHKGYDWLNPPDRATMVKNIEYRLGVAKQRKKVARETLS